MSKEEYTIHWRCRNCGTESPVGETQCPNCHADLVLFGQQVFDGKKPPKPPVRDFIIEDAEEEAKKRNKVQKKKKRRKGLGNIEIALLVVVLLLIGAVALLLMPWENVVEMFSPTTTEPVPTESIGTEPPTTLPPTTVPPTTVPPATEPPATVLPTTEATTETPTTEPPTTEPPVAEGPWLKNVLKADFKVTDYKFCSFMSSSGSRSEYQTPTHIVFVDNLKSLQNPLKHKKGTYVSKFIGSIVIDNYRIDYVNAAWDVSEAQDGSVWAWYADGHPDDVSTCDRRCDYILYIGAEGGVNASLACNEMFANCTDLKYIDFRGCFHTNGAVNMEKMFYNCSNLRSLDVTCLDTSGVTNMNRMFYGLNNACRLTIDLNSFDTSHVTDYENFMYYGNTINGIPWTKLFH